MTYRPRLVRGCNYPVESSLFCEARQNDDAGRRRPQNAHAPKRGNVHARQYRDPEKRRSILLAAQGFSRSLHHGDAAQGMHVDHPYPREFRRRGDRPRNGIWYVVEL
jgi:hypothetical protein